MYGFDYLALSQHFPDLKIIFSSSPEKVKISLGCDNKSNMEKNAPYVIDK